MEAVAKCSNLVLPKGFVELDREEMTYVDGGQRYYNLLPALYVFLIGGTVLGAGAVIASVRALAKVTTSLLTGILKKFCSGCLGAITFAYGLANFVMAANYLSNYGSYTINTVHFFGIPVGEYVGR